MVRAGRSTLQLELHGAMAGRVEVERTAKKEVALKIVGAAGPPTPAQLTEVRERLRQKGLRLSALSIG
jgi:hypothetical protein